MPINYLAIFFIVQYNYRLKARSFKNPLQIFKLYILRYKMSLKNLMETAFL